jgi:hypothetical protein
MVGQFFAGKFVHLVSSASITDLSAPSFSGISSAAANPNGSITASWSIATDSSSPVRYTVYIALGSVPAATLFVPANSVLIAPSAATSTKVYTLADQTTYLQPSQIYTFGVRANDAVGNTDTNTAIATATSSGVLSDSLSSTVSQLVATQLLLATDHTNLAADVTKLDGYVSALNTSITNVDSAATNVNNAANLTMSVVL